MATEITMPKLSDTMTEGQLGAWRKSVGDSIERGDIIAEVETDKAVMDLEAFTSGILLEQRVQAGQLVPVGTVIGLIGEAGESIVADKTAAVETTVYEAVAEKKTGQSAEQSSTIPSLPSTSVEGSVSRSNVQASPIVRRRASELGIDLELVKGSGPGNRIMLEDLEELAKVGERKSAEAVLSPEMPTGVRPLSRMRNAIAQTTTVSWQTIPHFYLSRDMEMDRAAAFIRKLRVEGANISFNALVMAAAVAALVRFPTLNSGFGTEGAVSYQHVNLGFAVALDEGLQVPVIREAEKKCVRELCSEVLRLAEKARQGTLTADEISGGSFTVSNLGMYGVDAMASIIMPSQAGILALGTVTERPVVHDGQLKAAMVMTATLSCDHRIIDGAMAAEFLNEIKRLLEHPAELPA